MRGHILSFEQGQGLISGEDGKTYSFKLGEWFGSVMPNASQQVEFLAIDDTATKIFLREKTSAQSITKIALVCWLVGFLGIHRFMVGKIATGMLMLAILVIGSIIPFCIFSEALGIAIWFLAFLIVVIWASVDLILILTGAFTDKDGRRIVQRI